MTATSTLAGFGRGVRIHRMVTATRRHPACLLASLLAFLSAGPTHAHPDASHSLAEIAAHLEEAPGDARLLLMRAEVLLDIGRLDEAAQAIDQAARHDAAVRGLGYVRAQLLRARGDLAAARTELAAYLERDPKHAEGQRLLCRWAGEAGEQAAALAAAEAVLWADGLRRPNDFTTCAMLYLERRQPSDDDRALAVLDAGLEQLGCLTGLELMACDIEVRLGRYDAALRRIDVLSAQLRPRAEFESRRAEILLRANRREEAARAYDNAIAFLDALPPERRRLARTQEARTHLLALRDSARAAPAP